MILTSKQKKILTLIGDLQLHAQYNGVDYPYEIYFEFGGMHIVNPMLDESGSYEVDPVEYYGEVFLESKFMEFI